jgi:hypothetical protein
MVENRSSRWTSEEDELFRRMAEANTRPELIAAKLNRSVHAVRARAYLPKRGAADFQAWRDQETWTAEKYRRFDRHERMPPVLTGDG